EAAGLRMIPALLTDVDIEVIVGMEARAGALGVVEQASRRGPGARRNRHASARGGGFFVDVPVAAVRHPLHLEVEVKGGKSVRLREDLDGYAIAREVTRRLQLEVVVGQQRV